MTKPGKSQSGVVLITTLIMLVMMTLLVLSMLRTNVIQLKIGGASQTAAQTLANAEAAIWAFMNLPGNRGRLAPGATPDVDLANAYNLNDPSFRHLADVALTVTEVSCIQDAARQTGNMLRKGWDVAYFDVQAEAQDPVFSGRTIVHQGVRSTLPQGSCK